MVIDFEKIAEAHLEGFKGGQGKLDTRNYVDDKVKIMYSTLRPGASTGLMCMKATAKLSMWLAALPPSIMMMQWRRYVRDRCITVR